MAIKCYWSRLPTEIRFQIYRYLVPEKHKFIITHDEDQSIVPMDCYRKNRRVGECIPTSLFYVSKQIYHETRDLLFSTNTFIFRASVWVGRLWDSNVSNRNIVHVSQFQRFLTFETLQNIQRLEIQIHFTTYVRGPSFKRIYDWMCELTSVLEKRHSLKTFKVRCFNGRQLMPRQYILEALVPLSGIKNVDIHGVDPVFAAKLRSVMMKTEPRKLKELEYPELHYKRRKLNTVRYVQHVKTTTRKYYDQKYDWDEVEV